MILVVLPDKDFDPTETSVPWFTLTEAGQEVRFATPSGQPGAADVRLTDIGFGVFSAIFMTRTPVLEQYKAMCQDPYFQNPLTYQEIVAPEFDGILIPGGHAPGMKLMLESPILQQHILHFFEQDKPVGAICHGVLLLARTISPKTGKSVLYGRKTTALPKLFELPAWGITYAWLRNYYRTYPTSVQDEVTASLEKEDDFLTGPLLPLRDTAEKLERGFTVRDGNYLSARWPGDCYRFGKEFLEMVEDYKG